MYWILLVQPQRNAKAARRFLKRLIARFGKPRVVVTDKLRSYFKPIRELAANAVHRAHKGLNNRIEGSHRPTRKREKVMGRFKSPRQAQRFLTAHDQANTIFQPRRYQDLRNLLPPRADRRFRPLEYLCSGNGRLRTRRLNLLNHPRTSWQCRSSRCRL